MISAAQLAGAVGYVLKRQLNKDLVLAVKRAACGEIFISSIESTRPRNTR
jgi:DNA-binding NarL/FixJ family response regulator